MPLTFQAYGHEFKSLGLQAGQARSWQLLAVFRTQNVFLAIKVLAPLYSLPLLAVVLVEMQESRGGRTFFLSSAHLGDQPDLAGREGR